EWWRREYNNDPYLEVLDQPDALKERTDDVTANNWQITDDLKFGVQPPRGGGEFWTISWTHLLVEWGKRGGIPGGPSKHAVPDLDWPGLATAVPQFAESRS